MEMLISYGTYNQNRKSASKQATAVMIKKLFAFFCIYWPVQGSEVFGSAE